MQHPQRDFGSITPLQSGDFPKKVYCVCELMLFTPRYRMMHIISYSSACSLFVIHACSHATCLLSPDSTSIWQCGTLMHTSLKLHYLISAPIQWVLQDQRGIQCSLLPHGRGVFQRRRDALLRESCGSCSTSGEAEGHSISHCCAHKHPRGKDICSGSIWW